MAGFEARTTLAHAEEVSRTLGARATSYVVLSHNSGRRPPRRTTPDINIDAGVFRRTPASA